MGGTIQADTITNSAGTGAPTFTYGLTNPLGPQFVAQAGIGAIGSSWTTTSATVAAFSPGTSTAPDIFLSNSNFSISSAATTLPEITISSAPAGYYQVTFQLDVNNSTSSRCGLSITDGTTTGNSNVFFPAGSTDEYTLTITYTFHYSSVASRTFQVFGFTGGTLTLSSGPGIGTERACFVSINYFPG